MEILKIINKLQSYSEDVIACKLDSEFACAGMVSAFPGRS